MHTTKILLEFNPTADNILPALKKVNAVFGHIEEVDAEKIADYFSVPLSKVYETASFYDLIRVKKPAQIVIQVCSSANCALGGSFRIAAEIENALKIKAGDEFNPKVRLEETSCLGRCAEGPIMVVNGKVYERVTRSAVHRILSEWI